MNAFDTTEDRVSILHSMLNDAAKKVGQQRLVIKELRTVLELIAEMDGEQPSRTDWDALRLARRALAYLKATGEA
jgi:hypothetical protein